MIRATLLGILLCVGLDASAQVNFLPRVAATNGFGGGGGGGGCTTAREDVAGNNSGAMELGRFGVVGLAFQFQADATYAACSATITIRKVGAPAATATAAIYTDSANLPGTLVGSASSSRSLSSLSTSFQDESWSSMSASLTSGTTYWLVLSASGSDNSNYAEVGSQNGGPMQRTATFDGATWTYYADRAWDFTLFSP